jgi:hypothetical protein
METVSSKYHVHGYYGVAKLVGKNLEVTMICQLVKNFEVLEQKEEKYIVSLNDEDFSRISKHKSEEDKILLDSTWYEYVGMKNCPICGEKI